VKLDDAGGPGREPDPVAFGAKFGVGAEEHVAAGSRQRLSVVGEVGQHVERATVHDDPLRVLVEVDTHPVEAWIGQVRMLTAQGQQAAIERQHVRVPRLDTLSPLQPRSGEGGRILRVDDVGQRPAVIGELLDPPPVGGLGHRRLGV
jgi:hypothetical protein